MNTLTNTQIDELLKKVKKIHFIGIGGSGMCPLAEILHSEGYTLTGSDNNETDTLARIRNLGIEVHMGHSPSNIGDAELVVYTAAIMSDNPELNYAKESGVPTIERSKLLGAVSRLYPRCVAVAGTHGKTTVTSMITEIMMRAGMDPTVVIGGKLNTIGGNGRVGHSDLMVCEACEFVDTFLELSPYLSVILNIDNDHLDYFGNMDNVKKSFGKFAGITSKALIVNGDDPNTVDVYEKIKDKEIITFGLTQDNDYYATNIEQTHDARTCFDLMHRGEFVARIRLSIPGFHNIGNAVAAAAAALYCGAGVKSVEEGLDAFTGAGRRFEILYRDNGITIADDYAHHPTELRATLKAAMSMGYKSVWAVFQPFTYSRTEMLMDDFAEVLKIPTHCVMSEIMGSREKNVHGVYTSQLAAKIPGSVWFNTFEEIAGYVTEHVEPGDLIITLGCGDIYKAAKLMISKLKSK